MNEVMKTQRNLDAEKGDWRNKWKWELWKNALLKMDYKAKCFIMKKCLLI